MTAQFKYKMKAVSYVEQFLPREIVTQTGIWCFGASVWGIFTLYNCVHISRSCILCNIFVQRSICVCLYTCAFTCLLVNPSAWLSLCQCESLFDQHLVQLQRLRGLSSLSYLFSSLWCVIFIYFLKPPLFSTFLKLSLGHTDYSLFPTFNCSSNTAYLKTLQCKYDTKL